MMGLRGDNQAVAPKTTYPTVGVDRPDGHVPNVGSASASDSVGAEPERVALEPRQFASSTFRHTSAFTYRAALVRIEAMEAAHGYSYRVLQPLPLWQNARPAPAHGCGAPCCRGAA